MGVRLLFQGRNPHVVFCEQKIVQDVYQYRPENIHIDNECTVRSI